MRKNAGQISLISALIGGIAMITASGLTGWFSASSAIRAQISKIDVKVQVVEERETNHYEELTKLMDKFDKN